MTEQVQLTATTRADFVADLSDHFASLGLTLPTITWDSAHPHGHASLAMDDGTRVMIVSLEMAPPRPPLAVNILIEIEGENAALWAQRFSVPLASGDSTTITATRGQLEVPATARGTAIVRPRSPVGVFAGIVPPPALETDYPEPPEWELRGPPGVENGYMLGEMTVHADKRWLQTLDLPESAPGAFNGGNYSEPGSPASGWVTQFADAEPTWAAGNVYTQPIVVRWPNNGTNGPIHRYTLLTATETSLVGREPHQAYMWAVWRDDGVAP